MQTTRVSNDLRLTLISTGEVINVDNHFTNSSYALNAIEFADGTVCNVTTISGLVQQSAAGNSLFGDNTAGGLDLQIIAAAMQEFSTEDTEPQRFDSHGFDRNERRLPNPALSSRTRTHAMLEFHTHGSLAAGDLGDAAPASVATAIGALATRTGESHGFDAARPELFVGQRPQEPLR